MKALFSTSQLTGARVEHAASGAMLFLIVLALTVTAGAQVTVAPIKATGWTNDTMAEDILLSSSDGFDAGGTSPLSTWFVAKFDGTHTNGLPLTGFVNSAFTNSVAGGNTLFQFQPYGGKNTLLLVKGGKGTLTLTTAAAYNSIAVLAASISGGGQGDATINYDDNSTKAFKYNAPSWTDNQGTNPNVFKPFLSNAFEGISAWKYSIDNEGKVNMYETDVATDNTKKITSIDFTGAAATGWTGIFAISGDPVCAVNSTSTTLSAADSSPSSQLDTTTNSVCTSPTPTPTPSPSPSPTPIPTPTPTPTPAPTPSPTPTPTPTPTPMPTPTPAPAPAAAAVLKGTAGLVKPLLASISGADPRQLCRSVGWTEVLAQQPRRWPDVPNLLRMKRSAGSGGQT